MVKVGKEPAMENKGKSMIHLVSNKWFNSQDEKYKWTD